MSFEQRIRKLDAFKKLPKELSQGTNIGGAISILTTLSILGFIFVQFYNYFNPDYNTMILPLKTDFKKKMKINIDVAFGKLPCELITLQQQDAVLSSNFQINDVLKYSLDQHGNVIGQYKAPVQQDINQFADMNIFQSARKAFTDLQGCRLKGNFVVNEVPGIFRFTVEGSFQIIAMLMAEGLLTRLDTTHKINTISFGEPQNHEKILQKHPNATVNPLKNIAHRFAPDFSTRYMHYHLDVIPVQYIEGGITQAYEYIYQFNDAVTDELPAVYFQYHVGGITLEVNRHRLPWFTFLMELCSVVGGIFAIAMFLNNVLTRFFQDGKKGYQLIS